MIEQIEETIEQVQAEQPKETLQEREIDKEEKRLKRLGWKYVATTGFSNRKMRRQFAHGGGMYLDEQEGCYRQNGQ